MWKAEVVTLGLLVILIGRVRSDDGHPSFYGVKLCGREFIRAVIFTCGGSRWRRGMGDGGLIERESSDAWRTDSISHFASDQDPAKALVLDDRKRSMSFIRSTTLEEVLEALRSEDRKQRDVEVGLSATCCKWGCSKSEISSLC